MQPEREITYEDLLDDDDPAGASVPQTLEQLLAQGFPPAGGLDTLVAIVRLADAAAPCSAVRRGFGEILEKQAQAARRRA